jgi:phosphoribosylformimino-5-aminoimidazole carboxamide ribotide isomerase
MQVIPVIDIRKGVAVRAVAGRRDDYAPLATPLAASAAPCDVARGLLSLHAFPSLYIADLDAIEGRGANLDAVRAIVAEFPHLHLWVDAGFRRVADAAAWLAIDRACAVFGSESLDAADEMRAALGNARVILSLDFRGGAFLGPPALLSRPALWPEQVIVMTLDRVGAGAGPDLARLTQIARAAGRRKVVAAGGVRDMDDLRALEAIGVDAALIATALHDGRIGGAELAAVEKKGSRAGPP